MKRAADIIPWTVTSNQRRGAVVPLVDIPQMSDEKWQKATARNAVDNYTREHGKPPESSETALKWQCQKCEKT